MANEKTPATPANQRQAIPVKVLSVLTIILSFVSFAETIILGLPADSAFHRSKVPQLIHYFRIALTALITDGVVIAPPVSLGVPISAEHLEHLQLSDAPAVVARAASSAVRKAPAKSKAAKQAPSTS